MKRIKFIAAGFAVVLLIGMALFSSANKVSPVSWGWFGAINTHEGLALRGYDPVAYRTEDRAVAGSEAHELQHDGATWRFSNAANRATFEADPSKYAPQFGGFCAFAVSKGFTANSNPEVWHVHDDQLFVFDSDDVKSEWVAAIETGILDVTHQAWASR